MPWWRRGHPPNSSRPRQGVQPTGSLAGPLEAREALPSSRERAFCGAASLTPDLWPFLPGSAWPYLACPPRSPRGRTRCCPGGARGRGRWSGCCTPQSRPATSRPPRSLWSPPPPPPCSAGPVSRATGTPPRGKDRNPRSPPPRPVGLVRLLTPGRREENQPAEAHLPCLRPASPPGPALAHLPHCQVSPFHPASPRHLSRLAWAPRALTELADHVRTHGHGRRGQSPAGRSAGTEGPPSLPVPWLEVASDFILLPLVLPL